MEFDLKWLDEARVGVKVLEVHEALIDWGCYDERLKTYNGEPIRPDTVPYTGELSMQFEDFEVKSRVIVCPDFEDGVFWGWNVGEMEIDELDNFDLFEPEDYIDNEYKYQVYGVEAYSNASELVEALCERFNTEFENRHNWCGVVYEYPNGEVHLVGV